MFINVLVEKVAWKLVQKSRRGSTPASTYRFTEIGQTSYNKYIFDEKKTFQAEIWKKKGLNMIFCFKFRAFDAL